MTVKIVTDSVADLPSQVVQELGISVIPVHVCFGTEVYRNGIDLSTEDFYKKMARSKVMPTTAVPPLGVFAETYDRLAEEASEILFIALSSKLSGIYEAAQSSIQLMTKKCPVEVIDSKWAIMGQGFVVMTAARAAQAGISLKEVKDIAQRNIHRVQLCSAFDTLEYLKRGGRVGKAAALMGSLLNIHPIIGMEDGEVVPIARVRSRARSIDYLYNFAMSCSHIEEMSVAYVNAVEDAETLIDRLSFRFPRERIYRSKTSPVIGAHTGPNLLVLAILGDK